MIPRLLSIICVFLCGISAAQFNPNLFQEMRWRMIGPFRGGRTVAAAGIPAQPNVFYVGVNNGGVWKTTDFGQTWSPIFDNQPTQSIGALAIAPSDPKIIYVGSGEGLRRPDLSTGDGIYKSSDAGQTWQHLGLRDGQQIGSIAIDARDPNRVFVAVLGHPYGPNPVRGLFRSLDGGATWQKALYKDENTGAIQVVFAPNDPQTVYAVMWASRRPPWTTGGSYDGPGSGLYKSTDGGEHWRQLTQALPTWEQKLGRIGIGIAPSNPKKIYALVDSDQATGLYVSSDAGESWQRVNTEERITGRGSDFAEVKVDPRNEDTIYVANTSTYRSTDGGRNFIAIKGAPGGDDYHTVWINPENPQIILLASDQGATISVNGGQTWSPWYNQPTAQFYHVITDNRFPYWVYGGQQESGSAGIASRSDYGEITFRDWHPVGVEEYGYVAPDPLDPNIIYGGRPFAANRFNQTTWQNQDISPAPLRTGKYRSNRSAPLLFSPVDPHTLYLGSNVLFKTIDGGQHWQEISPDLTRENPGVPQSLLPFAPAGDKPHRGVIYSIGPSFRDINTIWIGTDDGLIQLTRDGGKTWQNVTPPELTAWSKVAQLEASHYDLQTAYAAINRFRLDDLHAYIYRTRDGGKSWQKITAGIPDDTAVNTVREDPVRRGLLFAGTERAVYVSFDDGDHWQPLQLNLPATSVRDLTIHGADLIAGTHGRSFWILDDITPLRQLDAEIAKSAFHLFAPPITYRMRRSLNTDTPLPPEVPAGQNPPDGGIIDYYLASAAGGPVTLEIADRAGKILRRFSSDDPPPPFDEKELKVPTYWVRPTRALSNAAGMHRFVWDLHLPSPPALEADYPIAAIPHDTPRTPLGPAVVPGEYNVKLTVNGKSDSRMLVVRMDPRVSVTPAALQQQFDVELQIGDALRQDHAALQQLRRLRAQIKDLRDRTRKPSVESNALTAFDQKLAALEGKTDSTFSPEERGALARVNSALNSLLAAVDSADAAPTAAALASFAEVQQWLKSALENWSAIKQRDLPQLNQTLQQAGVGALAAPE